MDILFNALALGLLYFAEWLDYTSTAKLSDAGYLDKKLDAWNNVIVDSKEKNKRHRSADGKTYLKSKAFFEKAGVCVVSTVLTVLQFVLSDNQFWHTPMFVFNLIVGAIHLIYAMGNIKNFRVIKEQMAKAQ